MSATKVEKLRPERRRGTTTLYAPGCTCCCCCCLHTIGGLIGAVVGPRIKSEKAPIIYTCDVDADDKVVSRAVYPGLSAEALFWRMLLPMPFVGFVLFLVFSRIWQEMGCFAIVFVAIYLPYAQFLSAGITFVILGLSRRGDKHFQIKQLAKLTAGVVVGTISGLLIMVPGLGIGWHDLYGLSGLQFVVGIFQK
jgi:hypothetical protein